MGYKCHIITTYAQPRAAHKHITLDRPFWTQEFLGSQKLQPKALETVCFDRLLSKSGLTDLESCNKSQAIFMGMPLYLPVPTVPFYLSRGVTSRQPICLTCVFLSIILKRVNRGKQKRLSLEHLGFGTKSKYNLTSKCVPDKAHPLIALVFLTRLWDTCSLLATLPSILANSLWAFKWKQLLFLCSVEYGTNETGNKRQLNHTSTTCFHSSILNFNGIPAFASPPLSMTMI